MSLSALEAISPEAVMLSQDAEKPTIGTIQEYPLQPDPDGTTGNIDASQEYNRLKIIQYTDHEHGREGAGPGVTDELPDERTLPTMPGERTLSVAVDAVALITTECITVTSAMRKHARWAHSSVSAILGGGPSFSRTPKHSASGGKSEPQHDDSILGYASGLNDNLLASRWGLRGKKGMSMQDDPLIAAFARLRNDLRGCTGTLENRASASVGTD